MFEKFDAFALAHYRIFQIFYIYANINRIFVRQNQGCPTF